MRIIEIIVFGVENISFKISYIHLDLQLDKNGNGTL